MEEVDITGVWVGVFQNAIAVGQAQTADELGDGDNVKTTHLSSRAKVVNLESRVACRTDSVSSIHQSDQTSTLKLASVVVGNIYQLLTVFPGSCRPSLTETEVNIRFHQ